MPTRTKLAHYKVPHQESGTLTFEDEAYDIRGNVVECPLEIGEGAGWSHATPDEAKAYQKSAPKSAPKSKSSGDEDGDK